jgi:hypothetical protein
MAVGTLGSFIDTVTPDINMVEEVFRQNEIGKNPGSYLKNPKNRMVLTKVGIRVDGATQAYINGTEVRIPAGGVFELGQGLIDITSLVFDTAVLAEIYYLF